jgi:hypothetical protein
LQARRQRRLSRKFVLQRRLRRARHSASHGARACRTKAASVRCRAGRFSCF